MISCFTCTWFPLRGWFIGFDNDCYGDVVIWLGRFYMAWNWNRSPECDTTGQAE